MSRPNAAAGSLLRPLTLTMSLSNCKRPSTPDLGQVSAHRGCGDAGRSLLDEIVRDGARQMLAAALEAEVAAYVEQFADQLDENGRRLVVHNGYHQPRAVLTAAGAAEVTAPRVNDRRVDPDSVEGQRFPSAILPASARKSSPATIVLFESMERGAPLAAVTCAIDGLRY